MMKELLWSSERYVQCLSSCQKGIQVTSARKIRCAIIGGEGAKERTRKLRSSCRKQVKLLRKGGQAGTEKEAEKSE